MLLALLVALAATAGAVDTGHRMPAKSPSTFDLNVPAADRQGGDTIADATVIPDLPYYDTGTTSGFADDYDEVCPYTGSTSPDVVYTYSPTGDLVVDIDLCGSDYDTKLYVYDAQLNVVACNDDAYSGSPCGQYVSALEYVALQAGETYFIVIDGYGGDHGEYILDIVEHVPCVLDCPADGFPEGEPPLIDGYVDAYNGGCNSYGVPFQELHGDEEGDLVFCGVAGWYLSSGGNSRDTDWFHLYMGPTGAIELTADAEYPTYFMELGTHDCATGDVLVSTMAGDCELGSMTMDHYPPGHVVWLWVGSTTYTPPGPDFGNEYDYVIWISGLMPTSVAAETASWSSVKALFR